MATPTREISRFILPNRMRIREVPDTNIREQPTLAARIADLAGTRAADRGPHWRMENIVWSVLRRASDSMMNASAETISSRAARSDGLPSSSCTNLQ